MDFRFTELSGILLVNLYKYEILVLLNTDIIPRIFFFPSLEYNSLVTSRIYIGDFLAADLG